MNQQRLVALLMIVEETGGSQKSRLGKVARGDKKRDKSG